jgi:hypothetical protein
VGEAEGEMSARSATSGPTVDLKGREAFEHLKQRWRVDVRQESARDREVEWHLAVLADLQSLFGEDRDREKLEKRIAQRFGVWFVRTSFAPHRAMSRRIK